MNTSNMSRAGHTAYQRAQSACKDFYGSTLMQSAVAVLIVANCFVRINDVEMQPDLDTEFNKNLEQLDLTECFYDRALHEYVC